MYKNYRGWAAGLFLVTLMSLNGCLGYRLGSTLPAGIEIIHIKTFVNRTGEPRLELETTQAAAGEFQREGTLSVGPADKADVELDVVLTDFSLDPVRFERDANTTTEEYRMTIKADLILTEIATGEVMTRATVIGDSDFIPGGDLSSAKRGAIPDAAEDLAVQIVKACVEFW